VADSAIPVDLLNPGQVFACLGILEAADVVLGDAVAAFDWNRDRETFFRVSAAGAEPPVERVMRFLEEARVVVRAPGGSPNVSSWKRQWGDAPEVDDPGDPFPFPDPGSPTNLPVALRDDDGNTVAVDFWGEPTKCTRRDQFKLWPGAGGKPGAAIFREAIQKVRGKMRQHVGDPFALTGAQSISFHFDRRRGYIPTEIGFSPNQHGKSMKVVGFPLVDALAAIGMKHARPARMDRLKYRYSLLGSRNGQLLDPVFHRAALGSADCIVPGWPFRRFVMQLDWPGQEDQARCITQVSEEEVIR